MTTYERAFLDKGQQFTQPQDFGGGAKVRGQTIDGQVRVKRRDVLTPVGLTPSDGDHYLMPASGAIAGAWATAGLLANEIAAYTNGVWTRVAAFVGQSLFDEATGERLEWYGGAWRIVGGAGHVGAVATYSALTATAAFDGGVYTTTGRLASGDGGQGDWEFRAASTAAANGGTILAHNSGVGRFHRVYTGPVEISWFGARATGRVRDDAVTNGTTTVTSATAGFTAADVGKVLYLGGPIASIATTIVSVTNAATIVIGVTAPAATGVRLIWGHNDTAAWQAALDFAETTGAQLRAPLGRSMINAPIIYDTVSQTQDPTEGRQSALQIIGHGSAASLLQSVHADALLDLRFAAGSFTGLKIEGVGLHGPLRRPSSIGILIDNCGYFALRDCDIAYFDYGISGTDILLGEIESGAIRLNERGWYFAYGDFSRPNAITFNNVAMQTNYTCAGIAEQCHSLIISGGSIEGNGIGKSLASVDACGVLVRNCGNEGAVGLELRGVYIEGNNGVADVYIVQTTNEAQHNISASFVRFKTNQYTTYNVYFDKDAARTKSFVAVADSAFKGLGTYVESAGRPYLGGSTPASFSDGGGNSFSDPVAKNNALWTPAFMPRYTLAQVPAASAWAGQFCLIEDAGGGPRLVQSDGTRWRAPRASLSALSADADRTFTPLSAAESYIMFGAMSANRTITLASTNALGQTPQPGEFFVIGRNATGAFNLNINNAGGGLIRALTVNQWAEFVWDGSSWFVFRSGTI